MIGREPEREAVEAFLDSVAVGPAAVALEGEAGIGKTTVWQYALSRAADRGYRVLASRPAASEARLTFSGLADLMAGVDDTVLAALPPPQRGALAAALLRESPVAGSPEPRAVFAALSSVLARLAERRPVVVAVDDLQWLDRPSQNALEFAVRRIGDRRIGFLASVRAGEGGRPTPGLARALEEAGLRRVLLGPLSVAALQGVIRDRLGHQFPRPTLVRITATARGNPLFALEIGRELLRRGHLGPGEVLPVPDDLSHLVAGRIGRLPAPTRDALLMAAALSEPTTREVDPGPLARAVETGIVTVENGRIAFHHPLYAAAVYGSSSPSHRRRVHRRLARLVRDREERARHLALGAERPLARIAAALEDAAERARARGAPEAAAELMELAVRQTPPSREADRLRRTLAAAEHSFHAGDLARARTLAEGVLARAPAGHMRGHALRLLGELRYHDDSFAEAIPLLEAALGELGDDPATVDIHVNLAYAHVNLGNVAATGPYAAAAVRLARAHADAGTYAVALAVSAIVDAYHDRPLDRARIEQAIALEDLHRRTVMPMRPSLIGAILFDWEDDLERSTSLFAELRRRTIERGEESDLPLLSAQYSMAERRRGRLEAALALADEGAEIARTLGSPAARLLTVGERCYVLATLGDVTRARADADEARCLLATSEHGFGAVWARAAIAFLELSLDDPEGALAALDPVARTVEANGVCDPISAMFIPDFIEALIVLGRLDRADSLTELLAEHGRRTGRRTPLAVAGRCRALALGARGRIDEALDAIGTALGQQPPTIPLSVGRTLLAKGRLERRARRKRAARETLEAATRVFDALGARLWAEKARAEFRRTGLEHVGPTALTPTERRVAELAARGLTSRRIAEEVFISPKTVEANLARIYAKLGISSRAELGRAVAQLERTENAETS